MNIAHAAEVAATRFPILLVDDQPLVAMALRSLIADQEDIAIHYCRDPVQAIELAHTVRPMVVLLDLVMPDLDGLTLCQMFRADPVVRELPIIMLSGNDDAAVKASAFGAGANDYLVKLPDKIELVARLRYHARAHLTQLQRDEAYQALRESQRQLEALNEELRHLAAHDGLTGLYNRRYFNERLREEWRRASREGRSLSLIMIDVDHFKAYNDHYGHLAGDDCLKALGQVFSTVVGRAPDVAARYGGEEFALLLPETQGAGALHVASRVREAVLALSLPHAASATAPQVTISMSAVCQVPAPGTDSDTLIEAADQRLYEAKRQGRNRIVTELPGAA